jgi:hypothetical protein
LAEQIQCQGHDIDIAGAFAVTEQRAFDAIRPSHYGQLGSCHRSSAIVVRVQAESDAVAVADVAAKPFDLIGIDVRRCHFDGSGKVEDRLFPGARSPDIHHRPADLDREVELGPGKALGRILINYLGLRHRCGEVANEPGAGHGNVDDPRLVETEDDPPLQCGCRIVEVHDGAPRSPDRLETSPD